MPWLLYYNIYSSICTLQTDLNIYGQVVSSGEMVCEGTYYLPITINYHDYVSPILLLFHN